MSTLPSFIITAYTGKAGVGKSFCAQRRAEELQQTGGDNISVYMMRLADPIKAGLYAMLEPYVWSSDELRAAIYGPSELRQTKLSDLVPYLERSESRLGNQTIRSLLQTLGTEWGRNTVHPDIWVELFKARTRKLIAGRVAAWDKREVVVINDDMRFPNEQTQLKKMAEELGTKFITVRVTNSTKDCKKGKPTDQHESEAWELPADVTLDNPH